MKTWFNPVVIALVAAVASPASANLIVNGGFETGDFTGWTLSGNVDGNTFVSTSGFDGYSPHSGNYFAALGAVGSDNILSQTVNDTVGQTLDLTYFLAADGGTPSDFHVDWNGVEIAGSSLTNSSRSGYIEYSFDVLATGTDTVSFYSRNDPSYWALDDISLNNVPEPASLALLGTGLVAAAGAIRRRKKQRAKA